MKNQTIPIWQLIDFWFFTFQLVTHRAGKAKPVEQAIEVGLPPNRNWFHGQRLHSVAILQRRGRKSLNILFHDNSDAESNKTGITIGDGLLIIRNNTS